MTAGAGRGGKREGAGRPLIGETRTERRSVTLEEAHWRWLDATGNASAALRELVAAAMTQANSQ